MQVIPAAPLLYEFSRHTAPRAEIESGTTLIVESEDALSGQLRFPADRRDKKAMPWSNPVNGPIVVRDAQPGDALAVHIISIEPLIGQCATYTGPPRMLSEWLGSDVPPGTRICPIRDGQIAWSDTVSIPYAPMLGCLGTAPDWGVPSTAPAGNYGGNMDLLEVCPGNIVYLPVFVPGGYLYLGDAHAAQGHGELSATALEMPARTTIRVELIKSASLLSPRIVSPTELISVAVALPIERAIAESYAKLILWLEADYGWNRWQAYDLLTQVGQLSIGYYTTGAVAAKVALRYATASANALT